MDTLINVFTTAVSDLQTVLKDDVMRLAFAFGLAAIVTMLIVPIVRKLMAAIALMTVGLIVLIIIIDALAKAGIL